MDWSDKYVDLAWYLTSWEQRTCPVLLKYCVLFICIAYVVSRELNPQRVLTPIVWLYYHSSWQGKNEEIWLRRMTKALTPTKKIPKSNVTTQKHHQNSKVCSHPYLCMATLYYFCLVRVFVHCVYWDIFHGDLLISFLYCSILFQCFVLLLLLVLMQLYITQKKWRTEVIVQKLQPTYGNSRYAMMIVNNNFWQ